MPLKEKQFDQQEDQSQQENKNADPVDPMHILHPLRMRRVGIPFLNVEILRQLSPDSHNKNALDQNYGIRRPIAENFFVGANPIYLHSQKARSSRREQIITGG